MICPVEIAHDMFLIIKEAKPNPAHIGLAELERMGYLSSVITQNVDGLHQAAQARKYFTSLKQCGTALDNADRLRMVQLVGQALKKMADAELGKVGQ